MTTTSDGRTYVIGLDSVFGQDSLEREQGVNFVTAFNSQGAREWTKQFNNGYLCNPLAIAANSTGSIWTTGMILNTNEIPGWSYDCHDMAFGLIGLGVRKLDSNLARPFITRLGGAGATTAAVTPVLRGSQRAVTAKLFPNPLSAPATLELHVDATEHVRVTICDPLGHDVKDLVASQIEAGDFELSFSCPELPDGVYFLCVQTSGGKCVVPMTILR